MSDIRLHPSAGMSVSYADDPSKRCAKCGDQCPGFAQHFWSDTSLMRKSATASCSSHGSSNTGSLNGIDNLLKAVGASPELGPSGTMSVSNGSRAGSIMNGALHSPKGDSLEKSGGKMVAVIEEPIGEGTKRENCAAEKEVTEDSDAATSSSLSSPNLPNIDCLEAMMFSLDLGDNELKKEADAQVREELRVISAPKTTLPKLTPEMQAKIARALKPGPNTEVLSEGFALKILRKDMLTLKGLSWLNDEVINFYMSMVARRGGTDGFPKAYAFSTFFYPNLSSGGHKALKRWTKKTDIFSYNLIIIPVHLGMHWCLALVDFRDKIIRYFDSMGGHNDQCLKTILRYLVDESMDKKKVPFDTSDWRLINVADIPHQGNGSDCGMFVCKYAEYVSRDARITFSQQDMPYFRKRMVFEILTRKLIFP